jgi:hypothetical protein
MLLSGAKLHSAHDGAPQARRAAEIGQRAGHGGPSIRWELELAENHDRDLGARMAGASRMVNAIAAAAAAAPGLLSALDLPLITGVGLLKPAPGP